MQKTIIERYIRTSFAILTLFLCSFGLSANERLGNNLHVAELSTWLAKHPDYRQARDSDCKCEELIKINKIDHGSDFSPYRAVGDFDGDKKRDIAVVVVNKTSLKDFRILVFSSRIANGKKPLVYGNLTGDDDLGGLGVVSRFDTKRGHDVLRFGTLNAEGVEIVHIPVQFD